MDPLYVVPIVLTIIAIFAAVVALWDYFSGKKHLSHKKR